MPLLICSPNTIDIVSYSFPKFSRTVLLLVQLQIEKVPYYHNKLCRIYKKIRKKDKFYFNKTYNCAPDKYIFRNE